MRRQGEAGDAARRVGTFIVPPSGDVPHTDDVPIAFSRMRERKCQTPLARFERMPGIVRPDVTRPPERRRG